MAAPNVKGAHPFGVQLIIIRRGPNFCHVERIKHILQFKEFMTDGNQKWNGATPNLIAAPINLQINIISELADRRMNVDPSA